MRFPRGLFCAPFSISSTLILLSGALGAGCIYDGSDRCGKNQEYSGGFCVCDDRSVLIERQCERCGDNEIPGDGECVCDDGYARGGDGDCVEVVVGLGDPCDDDADCSDDNATYCAPDPAGGGYCTLQDCSTFEDCPEDFGCETAGATSYCARPPTGLGTSCSEESDCASFEASFCETLQQDQCLQSCLDEPGVCQGDWACCDFSMFIGTALCVPPDQLTDGACPLGGMPLSEDQ
jgi:hypothetical protein